ncbi:peptidoglycan bridge formation glycyltransferase FemA/FemB family protein [Candidatus Saccharibacteria bacterium]|nr:peptidoglycan bridge formation glycyltransferase FemA/FemB family protein [Candidatus Saccharibacteria bacterium]
MDIPFQQTREWQKLQNELGEKSFFEESTDYTYLAINKQTKFGNYLYLPYGPYAKTKSGFDKAMEALLSLARREGAIFIRIEPQSPKIASQWLKRKNAKKTKDLNPRETWVLDLDQPDEQIISNFTQGTRTCFNQFPKKGITITTSKNTSDIHYLIDLQQRLAKKKNIGIYSEDYYVKELSQDFATLYLAHFDSKKMEVLPDWVTELEKSQPSKKANKVIASSLFFDYGDTRYYMQSASDNDYRRLPATVAILTTAIFDAKKIGLKHLDFWGIAPDDAPTFHPWAGFTKFKKSFGGHEVQYCGTYDVILHRNKYRLYNLARKANRTIRKLKRR